MRGQALDAQAGDDSVCVGPMAVAEVSVNCCWTLALFHIDVAEHLAAAAVGQHHVRARRGLADKFTLCGGGGATLCAACGRSLVGQHARRRAHAA